MKQFLCVVFNCTLLLLGGSLILTNNYVFGEAQEEMRFNIVVGTPPAPNQQQFSDAALGIAIADATVDESAGTMTFTISLSEASEKPVNVTYATLDNTAAADSDYVAASGMLAILPDSQSAEISVVILDDPLNEPDETFVVELTNVTNATLEKAQGVGTILDNDELPVLSINDVTAEEKTRKMTFTVTLSGESAQEVSVEFSTVDDSAVAGNDYTAKNGTLTIPARTATATIEVAITLDENRKEDDEIFFLELKNPQNATVQNQRGQGTIQNTAGSFINRALGRPIPEPSTVILVALGLLGIGLMAKRKTR